jgi:phospholipid/cholesterol/gamma-HCH transport system permease protein
MGGLIIAVFRIGITGDAYLQGVLNTLAQGGFTLHVIPNDFISGLLKPLVFGGIITLTSCYYGLNAKGGTEGVGEAATNAVVVCSVLILATNYFMTQLMLVVLGVGG